MNDQIIKEFKEKYSQFKRTEAYANRVKQKGLCAIFKNIIFETIKNKPFKNEHLTGLIQMFGNKCTDPNFEKYIAICVKDKPLRASLTNQYKELAVKGYSNIGKASVQRLNTHELNQVKSFLKNALDVKNVDEAIRECRTFEQKNIPSIKQGIYTPWLHYINPKIFPLVNGSHKEFKKWLELSDKYADNIKEFNSLMKAVGEVDSSGIDLFCTQLFRLKPV
jgi:hypothetical protein